MDSKKFLRSYLNDFSNLAKPGENIVDQLWLLAIVDLIIGKTEYPA